MSNIQQYYFNDSSVDILLIKGNPWFCARNVAEVLELKNTSQVSSRLKEDEKALYNVDTLGGKQNVLFISESGLYRLIMTSRKPQAEFFQDWVCQELLPTIREKGVFQTVPFSLSQDASLVSFELDDYWTDTTRVAEIFGKKHKNVLQDFEQARDDVSRFEGMSREDGLEFQPMSKNLTEFRVLDSTYIDKYGRVTKCYKVNRAAFNYVVLGYQGDTAKQYRWMFIKAFDELERKVKVFLTQQMVYDNPKRQQLYIIQNPVTNLTKIGITYDIKRRLAELSNASGCELEVKYLSPFIDNAKDVESNLHKKFNEYRGIGEWFNISSEQAKLELSYENLIIDTSTFCLAP